MLRCNGIKESSIILSNNCLQLSIYKAMSYFHFTYIQSTCNAPLTPLVLRGRSLSRSFVDWIPSIGYWRACSIRTPSWSKEGDPADTRMTRMCQGRLLPGCTGNHSLFWWLADCKLLVCSRRQTGQTGCRTSLTGRGRRAQQHSSKPLTAAWLVLK